MNGHIPHSLENLHFVDRNSGVIIHYTCSAPSDNILSKYKIKPIGDKFGCANPREVLEIPLKTFEKMGYNSLDRLDLIIYLEKFVELISKNDIQSPIKLKDYLIN